MKVVNGYDVVEGRSLELRFGDFFDDKLQIDVLVISAWDGFYEPQEGTMIKSLKDHCGIEVGSLRRAHDLTMVPSIKAWISEDLNSLEPPVNWKEGRSRFTRLVVIESPRIDSQSGQQQSIEDGISVFQQMFRILALLRLHGIPCHTVATPLLNTGRQGAKLQQLIKGLRESIRTGFENVPELGNLVIFDLKRKDIQELSDAIDKHLKRPGVRSKAIALDAEFGFDPKPLEEQLKNLLKRPELVSKAPDLPSITGDIIQQLKSKKILVVAVAISARKLIEVLVKITAEGKGLDEANIYKRINYLEPSISGWIANALHGVRIFGNWMGHAEVVIGESVPSRPVRREDLVIMLNQLHCVVAAYPWLPGKRITPKLKRLPKERSIEIT